MERLRPFFPKSHGNPRVDDRRVLSGIIFIQRHGLTWKHASAANGPPKTLYNRSKRWSRMGVFATIMTELAAQAQETGFVMIDATNAKQAVGWAILPTIRPSPATPARGIPRSHRFPRS